MRVVAVVVAVVAGPNILTTIGSTPPKVTVVQIKSVLWYSDFFNRRSLS